MLELNRIKYILELRVNILERISALQELIDTDFTNVIEIVLIFVPNDQY